MNWKNVLLAPINGNYEYLEPGELEARYEKVQKLMEKQSLDLLFVDRAKQGSDRWLTNHMPMGQHQGVAIVVRGNRALCADKQQPAPEIVEEDNDPFRRRGGVAVWNPGNIEAEGNRHPTCDFVESFRWSQVDARITNVKRVGLVDGTYHLNATLIEGIRKHYPEAEHVDVTREFYALKAEKSATDIELMKYMAKQHDKLAASFSTILEPGILERDVVVELRRNAYKVGAYGGDSWSTSIPVILNSFPMNGTWTAEPLQYPGRAIEVGDCVTMRIQSRGICSLYGAIGRCWTLGEPTLEVQKRWDDAVAATDYCASLLKTGTTLKDVKTQVTDWLTAHGYIGWLGNCVHSLGTEPDEAPRITDRTAELPLTAGMVFSVRVPVWRAGEAPSPFACEDVYLITEQGAERLTKTSREIEVVL